MGELENNALRMWDEEKKNRMLDSVKKGDTVRVYFDMLVDHVTSGKKESQIFGFTKEGLCVSAPLESVEGIITNPSEVRQDG